MTQFSRPSEYLKALRIQYTYLKKFYYNQASSWLRPSIADCLFAIEKEINSYEEMIAKYKMKQKLKEENSPLTIWDILGER